MTFKHIKFTDSPTMRSLEKMALGNGAPIEKKASTERPKKDMTPTNNVFENLTKLCSGLRDIGLSRYADELEHNYMNYKQADAAYLTSSKDSGQKMLEDAHPEGSPKISDSEYAVIETIVDQQLKTIKNIQKTPTGKLASSTEIIDAVKVSLGSNTEDIRKLARTIAYRVNQAKRLANTAGSLSGVIVGKANDTIDDIIGITDIIVSGPEAATSNHVHKIISNIDRLIKLYEPRIMADWGWRGPLRGPAEYVFPETLSEGIKNEKIWNIVNGLLSGAKAICNNLLNMLISSAITYQQRQEDPKYTPTTLSEVEIQDRSGVVTFEKTQESILQAMKGMESILHAIQWEKDPTTKKEAFNVVKDISSNLKTIYLKMKQVNKDNLTEGIANRFSEAAAEDLRRANWMIDTWSR